MEKFQIFFKKRLKAISVVIVLIAIGIGGVAYKESRESRKGVWCAFLGVPGPCVIPAPNFRIVNGPPFAFCGPVQGGACMVPVHLMDP